MRVGLHDGDKTNFPNLALMKLSAWHKQKGDTVEWFIPLMQYDIVYSSKVFTFTPVDPYLPDDTIKGGTGYGIYKDLPEEIDRMKPDYSIYPSIGYAIGYLTRGCIRKCPWCVVPKKEGGIKPYSTWQEIKRDDSNKIVFMDNNVLACEHGLNQMRDMVGKNIRIDFNQGLDARLITDDVAELLSRLKWISFVRMSADTDAMLDVVIDKIKLLESYGLKPYKTFVYVLTQDIESAEKRCLVLKDIGSNPFAQPYRDFTTNKEPSKELKHFARWVNNKAVFKSTNSFTEYNQRIRGHNKGREDVEISYLVE